MNTAGKHRSNRSDETPETERVDPTVVVRVGLLWLVQSIRHFHLSFGRSCRFLFDLRHQLMTMFSTSIQEHVITIEKLERQNAL